MAWFISKRTVLWTSLKTISKGLSSEYTSLPSFLVLTHLYFYFENSSHLKSSITFVCPFIYGMTWLLSFFICKNKINKIRGNEKGRKIREKEFEYELETYECDIRHVLAWHIRAIVASVATVTGLLSARDELSVLILLSYTYAKMTVTPFRNEIGNTSFRKTWLFNSINKLVGCRQMNPQNTSYEVRNI